MNDKDEPAAEHPADVPKRWPSGEPEAKPDGLDPQIKAVIDEMRRVELEHKGSGSER